MGHVGFILQVLCYQFSNIMEVKSELMIMAVNV
jgi:hypothetical protein